MDEEKGLRLVVALIGLPGVGKTSVGKAVARQLGMPFFDCDHAIEQRAGRTVASLFASGGEAGFRDLEAEVLASLVRAGSSVIATGGGAVLRAANRELLRTRTRCLYLRASTELLWKRLRRDRRRPLLQVAEPEKRLREMSAEREPLYEETASIVVDVDGLSLGRLVDQVMRRLQAEAPR